MSQGKTRLALPDKLTKKIDYNSLNILCYNILCLT